MRDLVSMVAAATERCRVWPKTATQDVKCVRAQRRGAGSSRNPAIFSGRFRRNYSRKRRKNSS